MKVPVLLATVLLLLAAPASAQNARAARDRIAFTTDPALTQGCTLLGRVKDDEVKDLRRKIVRLGGDTAVVAFGDEDIVADVYRCPAAPPQTPVSVPPPPAGAPPPPPPR